MNPLVISRIITSWMVVISISMVSIITNYPNDTSFYRFGPQPDLVILGFVIDTSGKYSAVVLYALVNTVIRNLNDNVITPWIILNVQNLKAPIVQDEETCNIYRLHYEISIINTVYFWFDWLIYINMLLAQIDMFLIELITDIIAICFVTRWYIINKKEAPDITDIVIL